MGMYTELHFNAELGIEKDGDIARLLKRMLHQGKTEYIPGHPLFTCGRWGFMLTCDSYYFDADTHSTLRWDDISNNYYLCIRCNLKNYDDEIGHFLDWIHQYLNCYPGDFLGYYRYEEAGVPTLLWYRENGIQKIRPALEEVEG